VRDANGVVAGWDGVYLKFAVIVGYGFALPVRLLSLQQEMRSRDRAVLGVVNDAAYSAEDSGKRRSRTYYRDKQDEDTHKRAKSLMT